MMELETTLAGLTPGLLRYCRARTGDPAVAEEIVQDILTLLVERWRRGDAPESPAAFAFAIARRRASRATARQKLLAPFEVVFGSARRDTSQTADPEARALERDRLTEVLAALRGLPRGDREALLLAAVSDLDTATAARVLGISRSAYKMRLHRARKRLAERLEPSPMLPSEWETS